MRLPLVRILFLVVALLPFFTGTLEVEAIRSHSHWWHTGASASGPTSQDITPVGEQHFLAELGPESSTRVPDADFPETSIRRVTLSTEALSPGQAETQLSRSSPSPDPFVCLRDTDMPGCAKSPSQTHFPGTPEEHIFKIASSAEIFILVVLLCVAVIGAVVYICRPLVPSKRSGRKSQQVHPKLSLPPSAVADAEKVACQPSMELEPMQSPVYPTATSQPGSLVRPLEGNTRADARPSSSSYMHFEHLPYITPMFGIGGVF